MSLKFYKRGDNWIYQEVNDPFESTAQRNYYRRKVDGDIVSVVGVNTETNEIIKEAPVTEIIKNDAGDKYSSIEEFIRITDPFFKPESSVAVDIAGRSNFNTIFGEKVVAIRKANIAAQFQYGFPEGTAIPIIENGGTVGIVESMLSISTGVNSLGRAGIRNKKALRYIPGYEAYIYFTGVFGTPQPNSYQRAGLFDEDNGFFIGFEGTEFCVTRRRLGIDYKESVDIKKVFLDETFNPLFGNVYRISFGYLGFATVSFQVLQPDNQWREFYLIPYPNSSTETHITNTNLPPSAEVSNLGNTSNIEFRSGSFSAGISDGGGLDPASRKFSFGVRNVPVVDGEMSFITFRNKPTFNSIKNYIQSDLMLLNPATDLSKNSVWEFRKNMTITNTPTWSDVNISNSTTEYSVDATTASGSGELMFSFSMGKIDRLFEDVSEYELEMYPEETVTLIIYTPLGTNGTFDLSLRWKELF